MHHLDAKIKGTQNLSENFRKNLNLERKPIIYMSEKYE